MSTQPADTRPAVDDDPPDFAAWLTQQARGKTNAELSEALATVVKACQDTRKKGSLQLRININPDASGDHLVITDEIKQTVPEHDRPASVWFADHGGRLLRNDPTQPDLFRS